MHRRWWQAAALALAVALVLASVSFNRGRTLIVSDMSGAPIVGAYVIYHHEGTTYALVDAVSYQASELAVLQSDSRGGVRIPWAVHVHLPVIRTHPAVSIDLVYAPSLHNALASVSRYGVVSRPGEFEASDDKSSVRLADVSGDPNLWQGTLMNLGSLLGRLTRPALGGEETRRLTGEIAGHFRNEYEAILARHGESLRAVPRMPAAVLNGGEQEKRLWEAMVEKDLAQRPRWGDELRRRFADEVRLYTRPPP